MKVLLYRAESGERFSKEYYFAKSWRKHVSHMKSRERRNANNCQACSHHWSRNTPKLLLSRHFQLFFFFASAPLFGQPILLVNISIAFSKRMAVEMNQTNIHKDRASGRIFVSSFCGGLAVNGTWTAADHRPRIGKILCDIKESDDKDWSGGKEESCSPPMKSSWNSQWAPAAAWQSLASAFESESQVTTEEVGTWGQQQVQLHIDRSAVDSVASHPIVSVRAIFTWIMTCFTMGPCHVESNKWNWCQSITNRYLQALTISKFNSHPKQWSGL